VTRRALLAADVLGLVIAFVLAGFLTNWNDFGTGVLNAFGETLAFALSLPLWVIAAKLSGLYDRDEQQVDRSQADDLIGVFTLLTVGSWILFVFTKLTGLAHPNVSRLVLFWACAIVLITLLRTVARALCRRHSSFVQNTVVVGAGEVGQLVARKLRERAEFGLKAVGFVDSRPREPGELGELEIIGRPEELPRLIREFDVERVIFAFSCERDYEVLPLIRKLGELGVQIEIVPRFFDVIGPGLDVHSIGGLPILGTRPFRLERSAQFLKRAFDLVVSAGLLLLLVPVFALIAIAIKLDSRGPVFFRQVRMGTGDRTFRIWKFRTMTVDADARKQEIAHLNRHLGEDTRMFKAPDDPRVTRIGWNLRRFCLDELPQLFNVLVGQMSLVGPRPLILDEDQYVNGWARKRLDLRPGMTGLWQVHGGSDIPFEEMIKLDYRYVAGWSLKTDLDTLARTIPALVRERQAY
jgi:exopolysaccharide biosynthesis polyprenyl glycosylphosphotransferase